MQFELSVPAELRAAIEAEVNIYTAELLCLNHCAPFCLREIQGEC